MRRSYDGPQRYNNISYTYIYIYDSLQRGVGDLIIRFYSNPVLFFLLQSIRYLSLFINLCCLIIYFVAICIWSFIYLFIITLYLLYIVIYLQ